MAAMLIELFARRRRPPAGFGSLADAWADTTTPHGRLMLTVRGGLAEFERELIRARASEGRKRVKAAGVHMGSAQALAPPATRGDRATRCRPHTTIMRLTAAPDR
jgi:DNA invertase Pin-like site-specific DNA recombinase